MAFRTAWRILGHAADTEDVVQESLLEAFEVHNAQAVANWGGLLRRIATYRALDALRRRRPEPLDPAPLADPGAPPDAAVIEHELHERLRAAIAGLPPREGEVFAMRYFGEMSNSEIAESLGIPTGAVAVALHKARGKLEMLFVTEEQVR
jgi:RNA polymerase sigma-70 factor (ECF subfamily)